jgi:transposase-like protein
MATQQAHRESQQGQQLPNFTEDQARAYFERRRWPNGPVCVHCGSINVFRFQGRSTRPGLLKCNDCRQQFSVTVGSIMEDSHLPLCKWALAFHLMATSKKGFSALQLQRNLGLGSYKTAWHLAHRIRAAMKPTGLPKLSGTVEADECYVGGKPRPGTGKHKRGRGTSKTPVFAVVERNGNVHRRVVPDVTGETLKAAMREMVDANAKIVTDENTAYTDLASLFAGGHETVCHSAGEYSRNGINTNTAESSFSLVKRGLIGVYHAVSKEHLHRYLAEFDFRWNGRNVTDIARRDRAVDGAEGKRLMYKPSLVN